MIRTTADVVKEIERGALHYVIGSGGHYNKLRGIALNPILEEYAVSYNQTENDDEKMSIVLQIVTFIQKSGGQFLEKKKGEDIWTEVTDSKRIQRMIGQKLRDIKKYKNKKLSQRNQAPDTNREKSGGELSGDNLLSEMPAPVRSAENIQHNEPFGSSDSTSFSANSNYGNVNDGANSSRDESGTNENGQDQDNLLSEMSALVGSVKNSHHNESFGSSNSTSFSANSNHGNVNDGANSSRDESGTNEMSALVMSAKNSRHNEPFGSSNSISFSSNRNYGNVNDGASSSRDESGTNENGQDQDRFPSMQEVVHYLQQVQGRDKHIQKLECELKAKNRKLQNIMSQFEDQMLRFLMKEILVHTSCHSSSANDNGQDKDSWLKCRPHDMQELVHCFTEQVQKQDKCIQHLERELNCKNKLLQCVRNCCESQILESLSKEYLVLGHTCEICKAENK